MIWDFPPSSPFKLPRFGDFNCLPTNICMADRLTIRGCVFWFYRRSNGDNLNKIRKSGFMRQWKFIAPVKKYVPSGQLIRNDLRWKFLFCYLVDLAWSNLLSCVLYFYFSGKMDWIIRSKNSKCDVLFYYVLYCAVAFVLLTDFLILSREEFG